MKVFVLVPCEDFDPSQLPSAGGDSKPSTKPGQDGGGVPPVSASTLPSQGQSQVGAGTPRPDNSLPAVPGYKPDNKLPGIDRPVDPGYGTDGDPSAPVQLPSPAKPFTDAEKQQILALAEKKFVHTELAPMRCIAQAARFVLLTRKQSESGTDSASTPDATTPDNSLPTPTPPATPDNSLPTPTPPVPGAPDQGLPSAPTAPTAPAAPDQGAPAAPGQLPGQPMTGY